MKVKLKTKPLELIGSVKHVSRFLWFPKKIGNDLRWLEWAEWTEKCEWVGPIVPSHGGYQPKALPKPNVPTIHYRWKAIGWIN